MPGLVTGSFGGVLTPAQVWALLNALIEGAPFSASLTRAETATGSMAFPTVAPAGFAWLEQLQEVPELAPGDKALIVSVAKIAGLLPISAEMQSDAAVNITTWVGRRAGRHRCPAIWIWASWAAAAPRPRLASSARPTTVAGTTLTAATGTAIAEIGEAGGQANTIAMRPTAYAAELTREDDLGHLVHPDGCPTSSGCGSCRSPAWRARSSTTRAGATWCWARTRRPPCTTTRTTTRCCCWSRPGPTSGIPVKAKSIRKLAITGPPERQAAGSPRSGKAA